MCVLMLEKDKKLAIKESLLFVGGASCGLVLLVGWIVCAGLCDCKAFCSACALRCAVFYFVWSGGSGVFASAFVCA